MSRLKRLRYSSFGSLPLRIKIDLHYAESASTTSSSSEKRICDEFSKDISATISIPELICRWKKMRRSHERFSRRRREELSRFPKLVDSIIVTNVALRNRLPQNSTSMFQWIAHLSYLIGTLFRSRESLEQERDESPDSSIGDGRKSSDQGRKRKQQSILSCSVGASHEFWRTTGSGAIDC